MELEYADYHAPSEVTTSSSLSALETLCTNPALLERIQYTAAVMEQLAERRQGKYTARLGETGNLFLTVTCPLSVLTATDFQLLSCLEHPVYIKEDKFSGLSLYVTFILDEVSYLLKGSFFEN